MANIAFGALMGYLAFPVALQMVGLAAGGPVAGGIFAGA